MRSFREVRMSTVGITGVIASFLVSQALAQSNVSFTLEMGGDNHASAYKAGSRQYFTPGSTSDGQIFAPNSLATWAIRLGCGGVQQNGNGAGSTVKGVANFVFDLELHSGSEAGPPVTGPVFKSTINDGQNGDLLAAAAFAFSFNLISSGPGRVVDQSFGTPPAGGYTGGPLCGGVDGSADRLKSATYPTPEPGKLIGMGAGYNAWLASGTGKTTPGLGMNITAGITPDMAICEGQLDLTGLPMGTYVLKVIPAAGNNVLRGDLNLNQNQNSFATAADTTTGDTITFEIGNPLAGKATNPNPPHDSAGATPLITTSPVVLSWTAGSNSTGHDVYFGTTNPPPSVSTNQAGTTYNAGVLGTGHYYWRIDERNLEAAITTGDVWEFHVTAPAQITAWRTVLSHGASLPLALSSTSTTTEPRQGGVRLIEIDFDRECGLFDPFSPIMAVGSDSNSYPSTALSFVNADRTLRIEYASGLPDQLCYTIDLSGEIVGDYELGLPIGGDVNCTFRNLYGDANPMAGGIVTLSDVLCVKARVGTPVADSPWADLDRNGLIENADVMAAKSQLDHNVCP